MADEIRLSFLVAYHQGLDAGASEDEGVGGNYPGLAAFRAALGNGHIMTIQTYMPELTSLYPTVLTEDLLGWFLSEISIDAPAFSGEFTLSPNSALGTILLSFMADSESLWTVDSDQHRSLGTMLERIFWLPPVSPRIIGMFRYTPVQLIHEDVPYVLLFGGPRNGGGSKGGMT